MHEGMVYCMSKLDAVKYNGYRECKQKASIKMIKFVFVFQKRHCILLPHAKSA